MKAFKKLQAIAAAGMIASGMSLEASADWEKTLSQEVKTEQSINVIPGQNMTKPSTTASSDPISDSAKKNIGTAIGGVVGAALGSQVGGGSAKKWFAVIGGVAGAITGRAIATPSDQFNFVNNKGEKWKNGKQPMDATELTMYNKELLSTHASFISLEQSAELFTRAKYDYDWKKISQDEFNNSKYNLQNSAYQFEKNRDQLNSMSTRIATAYDKEIPIDHLLFLASCNTVPTKNLDLISYQAMMKQAQHCHAADAINDMENKVSSARKP